MNKQEVAALINNLKLVFDIVRLVDVSNNLQYTIGENGDLTEDAYKCYAIWERDGKCENCISAKAMVSKSRQTKYEFINDEIFYVVAKYIELDGVPYILEIISDITDEMLFGALGKSTLVKKIKNYNENLYRDSLTGAYNRRYYDEQIIGIQSYEAIAMIDVDNFKKINDTYGHDAGDKALQAVSRCLLDNTRRTDAVIRYGGDEFMLIFRDISEEPFSKKLEELRVLVEQISLDKYPDMRLTISIGGCYSNGISRDKAKKADEMLYRAKVTKNCVVCTKI